MEENSEIYRKPKYTMSWLGTQCIYAFGIATVLACVANGIVLSKLDVNIIIVHIFSLAVGRLLLIQDNIKIVSKI